MTTSDMEIEKLRKLVAETLNNRKDSMYREKETSELGESIITLFESGNTEPSIAATALVAVLASIINVFSVTPEKKRLAISIILATFLSMTKD